MYVTSFFHAAGSCVQFDSAAATADGDSKSNRAKKQKAKQLKRIESVESASFSVINKLLEEVESTRYLMATLCYAVTLFMLCLFIILCIAIPRTLYFSILTTRISCHL
jgi:hypothetical protein